MCKKNNILYRCQIRMLFITLILCFNYVKVSHAQVSESLCNTYKNCAQCIQSKDQCAWCQKPNFSPGNQTGTKCNSLSHYENLPETGRCDGEDLISPENKISLDKDHEISSRSDPIVQIRPQRVSLNLRVGQPEDLKLQFAQAENYPVDLYYLMDLSNSMKDDKDNLIKFGKELADVMTNVTSKFQIGFGSFVDKVVMPFVSIVDQKLQRPCGDSEECVPAYSYRNHLSLTSQFSRFTDEVKRSKVSGNLDAPEGGFDGIVQVAVCENDIGWRHEARKFIVFATDASFHFAGDGKLGGIVKPNDGQCHLDASGAYTHGEILDYPSIAQINSVVKKKAINIIFAVTDDQVPTYKNLRGSIEGSAVGLLTSDSSNIVQLVTEEYQKITSTIEMRTTASEDIIGVTFYSNCGESADMSKKNRCTQVPMGTIVDFTAKIEVLKCPENQAEWKQQFEIYSVGLKERITVDLDIICGCEECEKLEIPASAKCNGTGTLSCGICRCDKTYFGERCQCSDLSGTRDDEEWRCRKGNSSDICSKRGQCYCGQCECDRRDKTGEEISGPFCECDNFSCDREQGLLCSGKDHGSCVCGTCQCNPGWTGDACECTTDESTCYKPGENEGKCSGKGECECGACKCQSTSNVTYTGLFCEHCRNCPNECEEISKCVGCKVHKIGDVEGCSVLCEKYEANLEEFDYVSDNGTIAEKYCLATDPTDGCRFPFIYGYTPTRAIYVKAQTNKECPPDAPVALIIGGGTGTIVLIGLLSLILWKIFTTIHDRQEYARFEKDREQSKFTAGTNPMYKDPSTTFQNPTYAGLGN